MTSPDRTPREPRTVILGAGAVGGSIGALLHLAGDAVTLVARGAHAAAMRRDGLRLELPEGAHVVRAPVATDLAGITFAPGDVALLATKLNDAEALMDGLLRVAGPDVPLVLAVNGIAAEAWATARFRRVATMVVWLPASHLEPGAVRLHSTAACRGVLDTGAVLGDVEGLVRDLCRRLAAAGFDAVPRADIARWKHAKWITNLGATAQALVVAPDPAARARDVRALAAAAQDEGRRTVDAAGLQRVADDEFAARVAHVRSDDVAGRERRGGSTWQSRQRGRPLETPWLEGAIATLARDVGVRAPVCEALAEAAAAGREVRASDVLGRS